MTDASAGATEEKGYKSFKDILMSYMNKEREEIHGKEETEIRYECFTRAHDVAALGQHNSEISTLWDLEVRSRHAARLYPC